MYDSCILALATYGLEIMTITRKVAGQLRAIAQQIKFQILE